MDGVLEPSENMKKMEWLWEFTNASMIVLHRLESPHPSNLCVPKISGVNESILIVGQTNKFDSHGN